MQCLVLSKYLINFTIRNSRKVRHGVNNSPQMLNLLLRIQFLKEALEGI
jgi:hypothetical protein